MRARLSHFAPRGGARMVDVGVKDVTLRVAVAEAEVVMQPATLRLILNRRVAKGDVLEVARLAGIAGSKHTSTLIPLCHPLALTKVEIDLRARRPRTVTIVARAEARDRTGVEMEALTAASVAALTVYDMCKAVDRGMEIRSIRLLEKMGGKSGHYLRRKRGRATPRSR